jgi:hypothetical protein
MKLVNPANVYIYAHWSLEWPGLVRRETLDIKTAYVPTGTLEQIMID